MYGRILENEKKNRTSPRFIYVGHHFPFRGHVRWSIAQSQLRLQSIEIRFQFSFLFDARRLVLASIRPVLLQFFLTAGEGIVGLPIREPWHRSSYPFEQIGSQALILLHKTLVLLIHLQYLADSVSRRLCL